MLSITEEQQARRFLLGTATETEQQAVGEQLLRSDEYAANLALLEDELIDDYARGALAAPERALFERNFFLTPTRQKKLAAAHALVRYAARAEQLGSSASNAVGSLTPTQDAHSANAQPRAWRGRATEWRAWFFPPWKLAAWAGVALVLGLSSLFLQRLTAPRHKPTAAQEGLALLRQTAQPQRPLESRLAEFAYAGAPTVQRDGGDPPAGSDATLDDAEVLLRKALRESRDSNTLWAASQLYLVKKDFEKARELLAEAVKIAPADARLHNDLGVAWFEQSKRATNDQQQRAFALSQGLEAFNQAIQVNPALLEAHFNRALCRQEMGLWEQAKAGWRQYLEKDPASSWAVEARQRLTALEDRQKKIGSSKNDLLPDFLAAYEQRDAARAWAALRLARDRDEWLIAEPLVESYLAAVQQQRPAEAARSLRQLAYAGALEQARVADAFTHDLAAFYQALTPRQLRLAARARTLLGEARTAYRQENFAAAYATLRQARQLFQSAGAIAESLLTELRIGLCLTRLNDVAASLPQLRQLTTDCRARRYPSLLAYTLQVTADAQTGQDAYSAALDAAQAAWQTARQIDEPRCQLRSQRTLVAINANLKRNEEALARIFDAIALSNQLPLDARAAWASFSSLPLTLLQMGCPTAALDAQGEAHQWALRSDWASQRARSFARLGLLHAQRADYATALAQLELAVAEAQRLTEAPTRAAVLADVLYSKGMVLRKAQRSDDALASFQAALVAYDQAPFKLYAYEVLEGSFLVRVARQDIAGAAADLAAAHKLLENLRGKILEERSRNAFFDTSQEFFDAAIEFVSAQPDGARQAFALAEESRARSFLDAWRQAPKVRGVGAAAELQMRQTTAPLTLTALQERVPAGVRLLQFAVLPQRVYVWVIGPRQTQFVPLALTRATLAALTQRFQQVLTTSATTATPALQQLAEELDERLFQPLEPHLGEARLLGIVPDKELHYLPFAALKSRTSGRYFIERHAFVIAPSATAFVLCLESARRKQPAATEKLLCLGNPQLNGRTAVGLETLREAEDEARRVAAVYRAPRVLLGSAATETAFTRLAPTADVIHFAGHSLMNERSPLLSQLLLAATAQLASAEATDGALHLYELTQQRIARPALVVLSACQTGTGHFYGGEGVISLARPFLTAGVPVVIGSLWQVNSHQSTELMARFHALRRTQHLPSSEALRRTQLALICRKANCSPATFGWAAFQATGGDVPNNL